MGFVIKNLFLYCCQSYWRWLSMCKVWWIVEEMKTQDDYGICGVDCIGFEKMDRWFATEVKELASFSINDATTESSQTRQIFQEKKDGPPGLLKSLPECIASYDTVVSKFQDCSKEKDWDAIALDIHAAGDTVNHCQNIADENGVHDSLITANNIEIYIDSTKFGLKLTTEKKDGPPELLKSLPECIASYNTVVSKFLDCSKEKDWDAIALDIHAAGDAVNHCQDIADENGAHDSLITANNIGALQIVALSEYLAKLCASQ
nr:hypothetical protein [Tanacetum cinerariifolium]